MKPEDAQALRTLILEQETGALGTLHEGEPAVSMVPYAVVPGTATFAIHVSRLAAHTQDMLAHDVVSLMVTAEREAGVSPQARPRTSIAGAARPCAADDPMYAGARSAYLARFPESEPMFGFADFSVFLIEPRRVRYVAGFAQAFTLTGETLGQLLAEGI